MTALDLFLHRLEAHADRQALVWNDRVFSYRWLRERVAHWQAVLADVPPGAVVALEGDFSPESLALFFALAGRRAIVVPLGGGAVAERDERLAVAEVEHHLRLDPHDRLERSRRGVATRHPLLATLRERGHPGLVLFSSGSSGGPSKAAVHDLIRLLEKFRRPRPAFRTIAFLLYDHIGGLNTMLHTLANGGTLIVVGDRTPEAVCAAIARHRAELLPTSPTFLGLALLDQSHRRHDLSSLKLITYGTEPMSEGLLGRLAAGLPSVKLQQTYGLSELGILRSRSHDDGSLWMKMGGEGVELRVVDGVLQVRSVAAMLGYLNAPSPFTEDGWLDTRDEVDQDGEYFRIRGRRDDIINVGGQKVLPTEVEEALRSDTNVLEAAVHGEANAITGGMVCARVRLRVPEEARAAVRRLREHCAERLPRHKVPVRIRITDEPLHGARFKTKREASRA